MNEIGVVKAIYYFIMVVFPDTMVCVKRYAQACSVENGRRLKGQPACQMGVGAEGGQSKGLNCRFDSVPQASTYNVVIGVIICGATAEDTRESTAFLVSSGGGPAIDKGLCPNSRYMHVTLF